MRTELLLKSASSDSHGSVAQVTKADRMGVAQIESRKKNCKPAMMVHNKPYVMATGSHGFGRLVACGVCVLESMRCLLSVL